MQVGDCLGHVSAADGTMADIWCARVGEYADRLAGYAGLLSDDERGRLGTYRSRETAERYVVTRALVRNVLGRRLGLVPAEVPVQRTDAGKPIVAGGVHFNVSHSGDLIVLALCAERDIGVDVERRRDVARVEALSARWLSDDEREEVDRLVASGETRSEAFLRVWSVKEARLKALGVGIAGQARAVERLSRVDVSPLDAVLAAIDAGRGGEGRGYVGAVAFA